MSIYARLLGIAAVVSGLGLPEALLAGDVWKGSWKFEFDRFDRPFLTYSDTGGKTVFRFGCGERRNRPHQGLDHDRQPQDADGFRRLHLRRSRVLPAEHHDVQPARPRLSRA